MHRNSLVFKLALHGKGLYFLLLLVFVLSFAPELVTGLVAKGVFDILQGAESVSLISGWITFDVGGLEQEKISLVFWLIAAAIGLRIIFVAPMLLGYYWLVQLQLLITSLLQRNMLSSIYRRHGAEEVLPDSPGEAISRFSGDVTQVVVYILSTQNVISSLIAGAIALTLLMSVDAWISSMVILPIIVVVVAAHIASAKIRIHRQKSREATGNVTGILGEVFACIQAVQVACAEDRIITHFHKFNEERRQAGLKDHLFSSLLGSVFGGTSVIGLGVILLLVGHEIRAGAFSTGDFALFQYYLGVVIGIPGSLGSFLIGTQQVQVSLQRLLDLMGDDCPEKLVELPEESLSISNLSKLPKDRLEQLVISELSYKYESSGRGIEGVNLTIKRGSFTVIAGRVASGKSTLVRAVLGLLPAQGATFWNGLLVDGPDRFFIPPRSAYVPQIPHLYSNSVKDNILLGLPEEKVDIGLAIERAAFDEVGWVLENGLNTLVGPRGVRLSGGQLQRTAIARMFIRDSELLVFDDVSSALDLDTEEKLWQRMFETRANTCLAVSNRPFVIRNADYILVLSDGKVVGEGNPKDLLETNKELQRIIRGENN